jgi:hypothetical protein
MLPGIPFTITCTDIITPSFLENKIVKGVREQSQGSGLTSFEQTYSGKKKSYI